MTEVIVKQNELVSIRSSLTGSSTARTMQCAGWAMLARQMPKEEEKKYATAGTEKHAQAEKALRENTPLEDIEDHDVAVAVQEVRVVSEGPYHLEERLPFGGSSGQLDVYVLDEKAKSAYIFDFKYRDWETDRKSTRLNSSHSGESRMPSSA